MGRRNTYERYKTFVEERFPSRTEDDEDYRRMSFKDQMGVAVHLMIRETKYPLHYISEYTGIPEHDLNEFYYGNLDDQKTLEVFDRICMYFGIRPVIEFVPWYASPDESPNENEDDDE